MNFALEQENMSFAQFTPKSMLITLSGTMVISYPASIVQGGGGMFYLGLEYSKISQKMVKCLISFAANCRTIWTAASMSN